MTAIVTFTMGDKPEQFTKEFHMSDRPSLKWLGIKANNVVSVELEGREHEYAMNNLGAAPVRKERAIYFGDEARRIFFN